MHELHLLLNCTILVYLMVRYATWLTIPPNRTWFVLLGFMIFFVNLYFMVDRFAPVEAALRAAAIAPAYLLGALVVAHFDRKNTIGE